MQPADIVLGALKRFNALKSSSPSTKTSVAIGGWNEGSVKYSTVASSSAKRKKLISDAVTFLQTYGFDGFDLDWEYPANRGGSAADKVFVIITFIILINTIHSIVYVCIELYFIDFRKHSKLTV